MPAYISFRILLADCLWGKGGSIITNWGVFGPEPEDKKPGFFPAGTHAIRWKDPLAWYWAKDGAPVASLPSDTSKDIAAYWKETNGGVYPFPYYTYSAGVLSEDNKAPLFESPLAGALSPQGPDPSVADALVVEVMEATDIDYLDKSHAPVAPERPDVDLPFTDIEDDDDFCKKVPEFCEPTDKLKTAACDQLGLLCEHQNQTQHGLLRLRDLAATITRYLGVAGGKLGIVGGRADAGGAAEAWRTAQERMVCAQEIGTLTERARTSLLASLSGRRGIPTSMRYAGEMAFHLDLGRRALDRSAGPLRGTIAGLEPALRDARAAKAHLEAALNHALRLRTMGFVVEQQALSAPSDR